MKDRLDTLGEIGAEMLQRLARELVARKYNGSKRRGPGRPRTSDVVVELVLRMADENPRWGYTLGTWTG